MSWSTDFPHHGNDWPYWAARDRLAVRRRVEDERRKIVCDNAAKFWGLSEERWGSCSRRGPGFRVLRAAGHSGAGPAELRFRGRILHPSAGDLTVERYFCARRAGRVRARRARRAPEGVVVPMAPQSPPHAYGVMMAADAALRAARRPRGLPDPVFRSSSMRVGPRESRPRSRRATAVAVPRPLSETALLVVEVLQHTLASDRIVKSRLYASAGNPEYWIVRWRRTASRCCAPRRGREGLPRPRRAAPRRPDHAGGVPRRERGGRRSCCRLRRRASAAGRRRRLFIDSAARRARFAAALVLRRPDQLGHARRRE